MGGLSAVTCSWESSADLVSRVCYRHTGPPAAPLPNLTAEAAKGVLQEHLTTTFLYTGLFQSIPLLRPLKVGPRTAIQGCCVCVCVCWGWVLVVVVCV